MDVNPCPLINTAAEIWLLADVSSFGTQTYDSLVHINSIGSNRSSRMLGSMDPSITYMDTGDDIMAKTDTLDESVVIGNFAFG